MSKFSTVNFSFFVLVSSADYKPIINSRPVSSWTKKRVNFKGIIIIIIENSDILMSTGLNVQC